VEVVQELPPADWVEFLPVARAQRAASTTVDQMRVANCPR
jgi:hypothetical protein